MDRMKTFILWRLTSVGSQYVNYFVDRLKQRFLRGPPGFWRNWVPLDKNVKQKPHKTETTYRKIPEVYCILRCDVIYSATTLNMADDIDP